MTDEVDRSRRRRASIAHHLNNPLGALTSSVRSLAKVVATLDPDARVELERLIARIAEIAVRLESNVAAIVSGDLLIKEVP